MQAIAVPGPGRWETLADHFPNPLTPEYQAILGEAFERGYATVCDNYGLPLETIMLRFIDGRPYLRPRARIGGGRPAPKAPDFVVRLLFRTAPSMRRAAHRADDAMASRRWRAEAGDWYERTRPRWVERNRALQAVDVDALGKDALASHLQTCRTNALEGYVCHFELHGTDLLPTGVLLSRCRAWGIDADDVLPLLAGHSPATRLAGGFDTDFEWRSVTGYDLDARTYGELGNIAQRVKDAPERAPSGSDEQLVRAKVPPGAITEFQEWLADARATCGVRDDNGAILGAWPIGLLRRAMLATGRRLGFGEPGLAVELTVEELIARLTGASEPSAADAAARSAERSRLAAVAAPRFVGPDEPLPATRVMPQNMAAFTDALLVTRELNTTKTAATGLHGTGVGDGAATGRAVVAHDANDAILRLEPGDILVARLTTPAYNAVLTYAGGLVVVEGGLVSHAAVIARELGLPTVIGVADAMTILEGSIVTVDPAAGTVAVRRERALGTSDLGTTPRR